VADKQYVGIDVGAAATKCMVIGEDKNELGSAVTRTGIDLLTSATSAFKEALAKANGTESSVVRTVATGFGRKNVTFADAARTEIGCQSLGCYFYFPRAIVIVDIGGQDTKVIRTDADGRLSGFKMNRKCAAGTGTFLEEVSHRLDVPLEQMDALALKSSSTLELGAYCTVFTGTEILSRIREGVSREDLARAVYRSVVKRATEMDPLIGDVVLTGGVAAYSKTLQDMFNEAMGRKVLMPPKPQLSGAFGAALFSMQTAK